MALKSYDIFSGIQKGQSHVQEESSEKPYLLPLANLEVRYNWEVRGKAKMQIARVLKLGPNTNTQPLAKCRRHNSSMYLRKSAQSLPDH